MPHFEALSNFTLLIIRVKYLTSDRKSICNDDPGMTLVRRFRNCEGLLSGGLGKLKRARFSLITSLAYPN